MTAAGRRWLLAASAAVGFVALLLIALTAMAPAEESKGLPVPGPDSADVGFARDMAEHHQQAVEMSFLVRDRTDDEEIRLLAYDIINTQANQRGMMLGWLDEWGAPKTTDRPRMAWMGGAHAERGTAVRDGTMPGMATEEQLEQLRNAEGRDAEVLYLRLMTAHHQGGIEMAQAAADQAETEVVRRLAAGMVVAQRSEIEQMADLLAARGAA